MANLGSQNNGITVNVSSGGSKTSISTTYDSSIYYSDIAREWAISNQLVCGEDYSSKYYANESKKQALVAADKVEDVKEIANTALTDIDNAKNNTLNSINEHEAITIDNINIAGSTQVSLAAQQANIAAQKAEEAATTVNNAITSITNQETTSRNNIIDTASEQIELIQAEAQTQISNFGQTGFCVRNGKLYFTDENGNEQEFKSSEGTSLPLFSSILQDHVLSYEESKGLALQGTYVYKTAIEGSRYCYPDFVQKCIEEFNNSTQEIMPIADYVQPINPSGITVNGAWTNVSNAFDKTSTTYATCNDTSSYIEWDLGQTLYVTGFEANGSWVNGAAHASNYALYSVDNEGNETLLGETTNAAAAASYTASTSFTGVYTNKLRIRLVGAATSYPSRLIQFNIQAKTIFNYYYNLNGHKFYNIENKSAIDYLFNTYGIADFYGVDEANERIFLPRNNWFMQLTTDTSNINQFNEAGLPNVEGIFPYNALYTNSGPLYVSNVQNGYSVTSAASTISRLGIDLNRANPIYGNSDSVQPPSSNKLLYYVVGNTETESTVTEVTEVTTSENDTIPLFTGQYFNFKPNNASWLKAGEQKNSGGIYTFCYNTLVNCLTEANNVYDLKVIETTNMEAGEDYSEYWKVNQDEMWFETPTNISIAEESTAELYFKVANAIENLELLDVGEVLEALSNKIGRSECKAYVVESYHNGSSGYNLYSNGYCEQWGSATTTSSGAITINLLLTMANTDYNIQCATYAGTTSGSNTAYTVQNSQAWNLTLNSFQTYGLTNLSKSWIVRGYLE